MKLERSGERGLKLVVSPALPREGALGQPGDLGL